ncbi:hypothetical protein [Oryza sativa Japonica Group]|uniref:Uncharacterized protein P0702H08.34 n=1 Tax=Oryza sativa subsp. japonica TaxID=39947 RepID=Q5JM37_ORYSJ|nr:hypothetical protein [Oryza sativa Japonica Group]
MGPGVRIVRGGGFPVRHVAVRPAPSLPPPGGGEVRGLEARRGTLGGPRHPPLGPVRATSHPSGPSSEPPQGGSPDRCVAG